MASAHKKGGRSVGLLLRICYSPPTSTSPYCLATAVLTMTPEEMYFGLKRFLTIPNPTAEFTKDQAIELLLDYSEMPLVGATCVCTRLENEGVEMVPATDPRV